MAFEISSGGGAAARTFMVAPDELTASANRVDSVHMTDYAFAVYRLYNVVNNLAASWEGNSSISTIDAINAKRDGIAKIIAIIGQYTKFMRDAAKSMSDTDSGIAGAAKKL